MPTPEKRRIGPENEEMEDTMTRQMCLDRAANRVTVKYMDYGKPEDSFGKIAALWEAYTGQKYTPEQVAIMLALLKIARISSGTMTEDSYVDLAGYASCAAELATEAESGE